MVDCNLKENTRWVESVYSDFKESCLSLSQEFRVGCVFSLLTILQVPGTVRISYLLKFYAQD